MTIVGVAGVIFVFVSFWVYHFIEDDDTEGEENAAGELTSRA